jgi:phosphoesterase RecJ-like protein
MTKSTVQQVRDAIERASEILIVSHLRPDGDAVGSLLAMGLALLDAGLSVQMVLEDGLPSRFRFLNGSDQVVNQAEAGFDTVIVVDCGSADRVGEVSKLYDDPDVNIDHHISNTRFGKVNLVWDNAASVTEILTQILPDLGLRITPAVGEALLTGLITDTIGFQTNNTSGNTLRAAATLVEQGLNLSDIYRRVLVERSYATLAYRSRGLGRVQRDDGLVWTILTQEDRLASDYPGSDDADMVNELRAVRDCEVAVIFIEQPDGRVKISWRAQPGHDTSQVATDFGGGGHALASGATVAGPMDVATDKVLQATRKILRSR